MIEAGSSFHRTSPAAETQEVRIQQKNPQRSKAEKLKEALDILGKADRWCHSVSPTTARPPESNTEGVSCFFF